MDIPLLNLKDQYESIKEDIIAATMEVYQSQRFILGPKVEELEARIAEYINCRYAVGVSSGTDALLVSLMCAEVGPGDLAITTPYTFFSTAGSMARLGAIPVFVDIDPNTYNMDPEKLRRLISEMGDQDRARLKAIIPVHLFGQCAEMEDILKIASEFGVVVIEDAAQAIGAEYRFSDGSLKKAGVMGDYGCFSFFPSKNLGSYGDGGMVVTGNEYAFHKLKAIRVHGAQPKYYHKSIGGNFRLDALQAAILLVKLGYLEKWTEKRRGNAHLYKKLFTSRGAEEVGLPIENNGRHVFNQFVIKVKDCRDELKSCLDSQGIGCEVYYPLPLHGQECFKYLNYRPEDFPVSLDSSRRTLALPVYPELSNKQIGHVVETIEAFYRGKSSS